MHLIFHTTVGIDRFLKSQEPNVVVIILGGPQAPHVLDMRPTTELCPQPRKIVRKI